MPRILCVEDDPDFQHLISRVLRNQGYEVHYAFTGPEGRDKALSLNPDLLLMDVVLPGLSGLEVIRHLRRQPATRATPVIVMTAFHSGPGAEEEARALEKVEYLRKPVRSADLLPLIRRLLEGEKELPPAECWSRGGMRIFPDTKSVMVGERLIPGLGPKRFHLLVELARSGEEVAWADLVRRIWGADGRKNDLEKAVERLRRDFGDQAFRISTTRRGYRLLA